MSANHKMTQLKAEVRRLLSSQRPREAQALLASAADAAPDPELWMLRGLAGGLAGDSTEAERCFRETIRLQPNWSEAHYNLGQALLSQGNLHAAARAFVEVIRLQPGNAQAIAAFRWADRRRWGGERIAIEIEGGLRVVCPRSLQCITTYVLLEQEDWFEPEIRFLRRFTQPGMKAVDVGANHGVYTLTLAQGVGPSGHVWAFEPASEPAECLAESLALNGFSNVTLRRTALSDHVGEGKLFLDESSELNRLIEGTPGGTGPVETVPLSTLDACGVEFGWHDIDFMKLDAEGAEAKIIAGGHAFLSGASPLVMFEIQHGASVNLDLVNHFYAIGYESYRYVPGIKALVPWHVDEASQFPQLNLFCARPDRAAILARRNLLVRREDFEGGPLEVRGAWISYARGFPCFQSDDLRQIAAPVADDGESGKTSADYIAALDCYAASQAELPAPIRYRHLLEAFRCIDRAVRVRWSAAGGSALARIAAEFGLSTALIPALDTLLRRAFSGNISPTPPFLPVASSFDDIRVASYPSLVDWFRGSILETWERSRSWSSFWAGSDEFNALARPQTSNQRCTPEMGRRRRLSALSKGSVCTSTAGVDSGGNGRRRNRATWKDLEESYLDPI